MILLNPEISQYGPLPPSKSQLFMVEHFGDDPFNIQEPHLGRAVQVFTTGIHALCLIVVITVT